MAQPITLRTVERFEEPAFTELVRTLLHDPDRGQFAERLFGLEAAPPARSGAHQVRVGAFCGDTLVGWSHAWLLPGGQLYVGNSAVVPRFRRQGIYTSLMKAVEGEASALGCGSVESHQRAGNNGVIIAKLRAGYTIVGTEFTAEMGLLVKMRKYVQERRDTLFQARLGTVEGVVRHFSSS